eukprot:7449664-Alexandrium_andersonii.AAC.1
MVRSSCSLVGAARMASVILPSPIGVGGLCLGGSEPCIVDDLGAADGEVLGKVVTLVMEGVDGLQDGPGRIFWVDS